MNNTMPSSHWSHIFMALHLYTVLHPHVSDSKLKKTLTFEKKKKKSEEWNEFLLELFKLINK